MFARYAGGITNLIYIFYSSKYLIEHITLNNLVLSNLGYVPICLFRLGGRKGEKKRILS